MSSTESTVSNGLLKNVYVLRHVHFKVLRHVFRGSEEKHDKSARRVAYSCLVHWKLTFSVSATEVMCRETELYTGRCVEGAVMIRFEVMQNFGTITLWCLYFWKYLLLQNSNL